MATRVWNAAYEGSPGASDKRHEGDDRIRDTRLDYRERMEVNHIMQDTTAGSGNLDGIHVVDTNDRFAVVDDNWATALRYLFNIYGQNHGSTPDEVICGDGIDGSVPVDFTADVIKGKRYHTLSISLPGGTSGRIKGIIYKNLSGTTIKLKSAKLECFDAPSGGACEVDIYRLTAGYSDPNAAGTLIVTASPMCSVAATTYVSSETTTFLHDTLADNDAWVFETPNTNNADNLVLLLEVEFVA